MALQLTIGCDPELWVKEKSTGRIVSAHNLLPGTKLKPHPVEKGAVQVDGVAAEFNIDPSTNPDMFLQSINTVTGHLQKLLGEKYELVSEPTCVFPEEYFKSLPLSVRELGCNPDFNAWTGQVNEPPNGLETTMRTAAGHIHVGWCKNADPTDDTHFQDCRILAKQLDYYLGMYSLIWDKDTKRRSLYGRAGAFRPKPYGFEYRPLSNVWLRSQRLTTWVWQATYKGILDRIQENVSAEDEFGDIARECIDGNVEWWTDKANKAYPLHGFTKMAMPPSLPKPGDNKVVKEPSRIDENGRIYTGCQTSTQYYDWLQMPENQICIGKQMYWDTMRKQYYVVVR